LIPAIVGLPTPLYPMQLFVEEAVPVRVKTQFNMIMAVAILEQMNIAFVAVLATAEVKAKATFPKECAAVLLPK